MWPRYSISFSMIPLPPRSSLFPYTTLFRSERFVFLGDLVGYGADAREVVEVVARYAADGALVIKGNHDRAHRGRSRSEEHTSELQSRPHLVCRLLLEKKNRSAG